MQGTEANLKYPASNKNLASNISVYQKDLKTSS